MSFSLNLKDAVKGQTRELILTPRIAKWNVEHFGGAPLSDGVANRMLALMMNDDNSKRSGRFGASSRGDCLRRQYMGYAGEHAVYPSTLSGIFADGTWRHLRWQAQGLEAGWFEEVEHKAAIPELYVGVSLDGVNWTEGWGFELKGTSSLHTIKQSGVPHKHRLQIHTMMLATGLDTFVYLAECKRTQEVYEIVVHRDDETMEEVRDELEALASHAKGDTPPEPLTACLGRSGAEYRNCPYSHTCLDWRR